MKKLFVLSLLIVVTISLTACSSRPTLRVLNWGEYINEDAVNDFEELTGYRVKIDVANSNELFYTKIKSGSAAYDIVIPSDYMVEKMVDEGMLNQLDYTKLPNSENVTYMAGVNQIYESMAATTLARTGNTVDYTDYAVPYFWGSFGIIYNNRVSGLETALENNGWGAFFDPSLAPSGVTRGMYDVPQFAYAAASFYLGEDVNTVTTQQLNDVEDAIIQADFAEWGDDTLKRNVESGNLDLAFSYTGDYLDRLYIQLADGKSIEEVQADFNIYIPDNTLVFLDNMVIPTTSENVDMAHEFINYFMDPAVVAVNSEVVGYATGFVEAYDIIAAYETSADADKRNWSIAYQQYYNKDAETTLIPLTALSSEVIDQITAMVNNVKS